MNLYEMSELAYKNGYKKGFEDGIKKFADKLWDNVQHIRPQDLDLEYEIKELINDKALGQTEVSND